ncbi:ubiquitin carboxyl-terminal hydrolase 43 isoform X2 [Monodelphis domestica]|uniref:ubiquitin carboxyl-terminal hydrolase 43 isoform X2 n=1 Tax=Monodelphis domestica TaxID=13616 RepID=UPI0024E198E5|nr:ubiquitin carboxyl-terminal hydrolase 43 isoform X2 [Monodelphis domestica]
MTDPTTAREACVQPCGGPSAPPRRRRSFRRLLGRFLRVLGVLPSSGVSSPETQPGVNQSGTGRGSNSSEGFGDSARSANEVSREAGVARLPQPPPGDKARPPGTQGLKNHGNTCFMNAVVQCLSNTDLLAEFLALGHYQAWPGRAEVTEQLAGLVRSLWTQDYTPHLSVEFKNTVSKYGSQFQGNSQHDALEFLLWLLDRVHEDLDSSSSGQTSEKPQPEPSKNLVQTLSSNQPSQRQSFVQNHFQAQYRSSLTCPHCQKQSNTFDPFLCVSLPIPSCQTRSLNVTLVFQSKSQMFLRIGLAVPLFSTVATLRKMIAEEGKISANEVVLVELHPSGFQRSFFDEEDLNCISDGDNVYAFQAPLSPIWGVPASFSDCPSKIQFNKHKGQSLPQTSTLSTESLTSGSGSKVLILLCNLVGSGHKAKRFGPPLLMREDRAISWDQFQQQVFSTIQCLMKKEVSLQSLGSLFAVRVVGLSNVCSYLSPQDGRPLFHWAVERSLKLSRPGGPPHIKLAIEWDKTTKELFFGNIQEEVVQDAPSVQLQQQAHLQPSCTLNECFQLYTKEEQLAPDDAWKCPHCKILQQGMVKLSLWTLPDILIIHLKRFCQVGERRNKLSTLVKFPLFGLNMAPHVAKRSLGQEHLMNSWPSWEQASCLPNNCSFDFLYDLYAVCNHHGSMQGGHYTAYCRNSLDGQWYSYDDSTVEPVSEEEVSTRGAYILFYQKRNIIPDWSASSSMRGSMSSSMSDHWLMRLRSNNSSQRKSLVSWNSANFDSISKIPDSPVFSKASTREEKGESESKLFVRNNRGRSCSMKEPATSKRNQHGAFKTMPLRWSLGVKDRTKHQSAELVEYLESGRRPKCTNRSIIPVMMTGAVKEADVSASIQSNIRDFTDDEWDSKGTGGKVQGTMMNPSNNLKKQYLTTGNIDSLKRTKKLKESLSQEMRLPPKLDVPLTVPKSAGTEEPTWAKSNSSKPNCNGNNHMSNSLPYPKDFLNVRNFSGVNRDNNERRSAKFWTKTQERNLESELLQQSKFSFLRSVVLKKEPKKKGNNSEISISSSFTSPSSSKWSNTDKEQGNKMSPCRHKEILTKDGVSLSEKGVSQAHSSFRLPKQVNWFQRASVSYPLHRQVPEGQTSNGAFQRVKYHTIALGQKKIVPESSL